MKDKRNLKKMNNNTLITQKIKHDKTNNKNLTAARQRLKRKTSRVGKKLKEL